MIYYSVFDSDPDRSFQTQWNFETEAKATMATIKLLMDSKGMSEDRQRTVFDSTLAGQKIHLIDAGFEIIEHERKLAETHRHPKKEAVAEQGLKYIYFIAFSARSQPDEDAMPGSAEITLGRKIIGLDQIRIIEDSYKKEAGFCDLMIRSFQLLRTKERK